MNTNTRYTLTTATCLTVDDGKASKTEYHGHHDYRVIAYVGIDPRGAQLGAGAELFDEGVTALEIAAFRATLPQSLLAEATTYPAEVRWWVLRLLAAQSEAQVRVRRSRAFVALAAVHTARRPDADFQTIVEWVARPCRTLLADMGLPPRPAVLRILAKVADDVDLDEIVGLASALCRSQRTIRLLSHERSISRETAALYAARIPLPFITPGVLAAAREGAKVSRPFPYLRSVLEETLRVAVEVGVRTCPWRNLRSEKAIGRLLSDLEQSAQLLRHGSAHFACPFHVPPGISVLATTIAVQREGAEQRNCLFTFLEGMLAGQQIGLTVEVGLFRGTLLIESISPAWTDQGVWVRHTLVGANNAAPPDNAVAFVDRWLVAAQSLTESNYHAVRLYGYNGEVQP